MHFACVHPLHALDSTIEAYVFPGDSWACNYERHTPACNYDNGVCLYSRFGDYDKMKHPNLPNKGLTYLLSKVNIRFVDCVWATAFISDTTLGSSCESVEVWRQKISRPEGDSNPKTSDSCRMIKKIWAIRARHLLSHVFFNTGSDGIDIYEVKFIFGTLIVRGQQHSFLTHNRMLLWKCQSFWDRKCIGLIGTRLLSVNQLYQFYGTIEWSVLG